MASQSNQTKPLRHWVIEVILGSVALGVAYLIALSALNSGSLLQYFLCLLMFGLGIRHFVLAVRAWRIINRS